MSGGFVSKRNRKRAQRLENMDIDSDGEDDTAEIISFSHGESPLRLISSAKCYDHRNCSEADPMLIDSPFWWHQVIILHNQKVSCLRNVIPEIHKLVSCYFVPIAYKSSLTSDSFFVHDQGEALQRVFENGLQIDVKGKKIDLEVKLGVAKFELGTLKPTYKLREVLKSSVDPSAPYVLNLSQVSKHRLLTDMKFSLSNKACFRLLIEQMQHVWSHLERVKVIDLSNNGIQHLEPLFDLPFHLRVLDIKNNNISSINEFQALVNVKVDKILLIGNPVTDFPFFFDELKQILPQLQETDEVEIRPTETKPEVETAEMRLIKHPSVKIIPQPSSSATIVVVREVNVQSAKREFSKHNNDWWNRVVIHHRGKVEKDKILKEMNKQFFNRTLFFPCYYEEHEGFDTFLLYKNFSALEMLVEKDLKMEIRSRRCAVTFELNLYYATWAEEHVDWQKSIDYVIKGRMLELSLDLSHFADDQGFDDLNLTLTTVQGISYILNKAKNLNPNITQINLRGNGIASIDGLQFLRSFRNLKSIDLSANKIASLESFPTMDSVVELYLDENDICRNFYGEPWKYVKELLKIFPKLEYLDGRVIDLTTSVVPMQNFYVSQNLYTFIESFIKFYFNAYDSNRDLLDKLYDKDAIYSISCRREISYTWECSRNLVEDPEADLKVITGRNIIKAHKFSPKTAHDFATMCVDVPWFSEQQVLLNVTGYFKQMVAFETENEQILGFTRSFILARQRKVSSTSFKYVVKNEQLQIREISNDEEGIAFKNVALTEEDIADICPDLLPSELDSKETAISILSQQTKLNRIWCRRFLEDSSWSLPTALKYVC